jgi:hypothetical protein
MYSTVIFRSYGRHYQALVKNCHSNKCALHNFREPELTVPQHSFYFCWIPPAVTPLCQHFITNAEYFGRNFTITSKKEDTCILPHLRKSSLEAIRVMLNTHLKILPLI